MPLPPPPRADGSGADGVGKAAAEAESESGSLLLLLLLQQLLLLGKAPIVWLLVIAPQRPVMGSAGRMDTIKAWVKDRRTRSKAVDLPTMARIALLVGLASEKEVDVED